MDTLWHDLRYALRNFLRSPGFTLVALLTLALGIGANTALFTVVKGVLLEPLPYPEPERLVLARERNVERGFPRFSFSPLNFRDYHEQNRVFEAFAAYSGANLALTGDGEPQRLHARQVTGEYFRVYGVEPALGRAITPGDDRPEAPRVAVLGHGLWQDRFGADPGIVGRSLRLDGEVSTVIGVMPPGFQPTFDLFVPLAMEYEGSGRGGHWLGGIARLAPGVTPQRADADLERIAAGLRQAYPDSNTGWSAFVQPLKERMVEGVDTALLLIFAAVALVLLIACANVANLFLSRMALREREVALKTALGAGRFRLVRQMLTESTLLAAAGGVLGFLLALRGTDALVALAADQLPRSDEIRVDGGVLLFTLGLALVTGLAFGLLPALRASRPDLQAALKEGGRGHAGGGSQRLRDALVRAEVAVALVLLVGAGLLVRSFQRLLDVDPGFAAESRLTAQLDLPPASYPEDPDLAAFYRQLFERLEGLPGVEEAGAVFPAPLTGTGFSLTFYVEGRPLPGPNQQLSTNVRAASPDYFAAMGIPLERGRAFTPADAADAPPVIVINRAAAQQVWPGEDPLGARLTFDDPQEEDARWYTVVGVVGDVRHRGLDRDTDAEMYWPFLQVPLESAVVVLKTAADPAAVAGPLRAELAAIDPELPLHGIRTLEQIVAEAVARPRFNSLLLGLFAGLAMLLAALGVYGLISYSVTQRLREIGVRLALGAGRREVLALVVRQGMVPVLVGIAVGIAGAFAGTRLLRGLIFGVSPLDPATFAVTTLLLAAVGAAACLVPAWRATRVDPMVVLRDE